MKWFNTTCQCILINLYHYLFVCYANVYVFLIVSLNYIENIKTLVIGLNVKLDATDIVLLQLLGKVLRLTLYINKNI